MNFLLSYKSCGDDYEYYEWFDKEDELNEFIESCVGDIGIYLKIKILAKRHLDWGKLL